MNGMKNFFITMSILMGVAGCGGSSSESTFPIDLSSLPADGGTPTVTGPIGGTITPLEPEPPPVVFPPPNPAEGPEETAPVSPKSLTGTRFLKKVPSVLEDSRYSPEAADYDFGSAILSTADPSPLVFLARLHGGVWFPGRSLNSTDKLPEKLPLVIFLHGQHSPKIPNYQGYDYMARALAAHGYVVLSVDANDINAATCAECWPGDSSSQSRGQLVLATLDKLKKINDKHQITNGIQLKSLVGKIDFDRIGIVGHSRGGQGINDAIQLNKERVGVTLQQLREAKGELAYEKEGWAHDVWFSSPGAKRTTGTEEAFITSLDRVIAALDTKDISDSDLFKILDASNITIAAGGVPGSSPLPKYVFKAALSIAPTDGRDFDKISDVPLAVIVPTCDGDVFDLSGARVFDRNRFSKGAEDSAPRFQVVVRGANHSYFNSLWTVDDHAENPRARCYLDSLSVSGLRLAPSDQAVLGRFVVNSFVRTFVGGETAFAPYWNGTAPLPAQACPAGKAPCDSRVALSLQSNGRTNGVSNRKLIPPFDERGRLHQDYDATTSFLHIGNPLDLIDSFDFKNSIFSCIFFGACSELSLMKGSIIQFSEDLFSIPNHLQLLLTRPDMKLPIILREPIFENDSGPTVLKEDLSTIGYDTLSFRVAMIRPVPISEGPLKMQEIMVVLKDSNGIDSLPIKVSDFSDALDSSMQLEVPAGSRSAELLNMVAIPLDAFKADAATGGSFNIDRIKLMTLQFPNTPNDRTKVALTDIQLQNFKRMSH